MVVRDQDYDDYVLDPEMWPEFMRVGMTPVPPSGQMWPDADATDVSVNAPDAGSGSGTSSLYSI